MRGFLCACFLSASVSGICGEADSIRTYDINQLVVTATRTPLPLKEAPVLTRVISAAEIERSGQVALPALLERELAGVEFHQAGFGPSLSFQGLDARYVLLLIDGERIAGETNGNVDYSRIPLDMIERIEIVRGASSVLYGSNAMGAVVNIITKMPGLADKGVYVSAGVRYGSRFQKNAGEQLGTGASEDDTHRYRDRLDMGNINVNATLGFRWEKLRSMTTVSMRTSDAYRLVGTENEERHYDTLNIMAPKMLPGIPPRPEMGPNGIPVFVVGKQVIDTTISVAPDQRGMSISGVREINVVQKFDYVLSDRFRFGVTGSLFGKERYDFLHSITEESPFPNPAKKWGYESYKGYNIKAEVEHTPNDRSKIYLSFVRDDFFRYQDSLSGYSTPKQRHTLNTPRFLWTLDAGVHRLTSGAEMQQELLHFDLNPSGYSDGKERLTYAAYVQDELFDGRKLSFVAGLRGDYSPDFGFKATPKLSAKYAVGNCSLKANYSMGYRTPSLKESYMEFPIPGGNNVLRGNPDLKPETNNYISLCAEYLTAKYNFSVTAYKSYFRNKIDITMFDEDSKTIMMYNNIGKSTIGGVEAVLRAQLTRSLRLTANYNYVEQSDDLASDVTQYIYPSPHTATLNLDYGLMLLRKCYTTVNASVRYAGAKDYRDIMAYYEAGATMAQSKYFTGSYSGHLDDYVLCGAGVTFNLPFTSPDSNAINIGAGVDNIFDYAPPVVNFNSAVTPGRSFYVRCEYTF